MFVLAATGLHGPPSRLTPGWMLSVFGIPFGCACVVAGYRLWTGASAPGNYIGWSPVGHAFGAACGLLWSAPYLSWMWGTPPRVISLHLSVTVAHWIAFGCGTVCAALHRRVYEAQR